MDWDYTLAAAQTCVPVVTTAASIVFSYLSAQQIPIGKSETLQQRIMQGARLFGALSLTAVDLFFWNQYSISHDIPSKFGGISVALMAGRTYFMLACNFKDIESLAREWRKNIVSWSVFGTCVLAYLKVRFPNLVTLDLLTLDPQALKALANEVRSLPETLATSFRNIGTAIGNRDLHSLWDTAKYIVMPLPIFALFHGTRADITTKYPVRMLEQAKMGAYNFVYSTVNLSPPLFVKSATDIVTRINRLRALKTREQPSPAAAPANALTAPATRTTAPAM